MLENCMENGDRPLFHICTPMAAPKSLQSRSPSQQSMNYNGGTVQSRWLRPKAPLGSTPVVLFDDAEAVMDRPLYLIHHEVVGTSEDDGGSTTGTRAERGGGGGTSDIVKI